ncbi:MAG TPA: flagellar hook capping FlgD N-terminal domain-containing protein, partial [Rhizomicrobium sp.]
TPPATTSPTDAAQELSGNFDTFLTLLTTQLQNQDPLSPMDSTQFTQQLVEFSQVEQQIDTNTNLNTLITQGQSQSGAYAASYLGRQVTLTNGQGSLQNGTADWNYDLSTASATTALTVTDANGDVVYNTTGANTPGVSDFTWNGEDNNGNQLPDGAYTLSVSAQDSSGDTVTTAVKSTGTVSEVDMTSGTPQLMIGALSVPLADISAVSN